MKLAGVARFDCIGSTQEFACYMAGLASPGDHTCGWTTSTLHSHLAWRYWFRWGCGASSTTSVIADLAGSHIPYPRSTGPDHAAIHPIRRGTPDQKGCNAYGSGAAHPISRTNAESARQPPTHTRPRELALPGPSAFSDHQPAFNNRRSVVTNHRSAANSPSTIINRRSADTPRRAVAAIRDGNASGGQPVA